MSSFFSTRPELREALEAWLACPPYIINHTRMDVFDNEKIRSDNTSGVTGVRFEKGKWVEFLRVHHSWSEFIIPRWRTRGETGDYWAVTNNRPL